MRQLLALAEHGGIARAAQALRLSQPALSRSVQVIERQAGTALFVRTAKGVEPTDVGRLYVSRARQIVQLAEELEREAASDRTLQSGQVAVGGGPYPAQSVLSTALARFVGAHPRVSTRLQMRDWDDLLRGLRSRDLDFFVAEISTLLQEPDLDIEPQAPHPLYFVARRGHPLAGRPNVGAEETFSYPFASLSRISPRILGPMRAAQRQSPDPAAAMRSFPAVECNSLSAVTRIVTNSDAVTASTLPCIASELDRGELALLGTEPWLFLRYGLVRLKGHSLSLAATEFRAFALEAEQATTIEEQRLVARWAPSFRHDMGGDSESRA